MEVGVPNGDSVISKKGLNGKTDIKLCNGDSTPVNGQNGSHKTECEAMDVSEVNDIDSKDSSNEAKDTNKKSENNESNEKDFTDEKDSDNIDKKNDASKNNEVMVNEESSQSSDSSSQKQEKAEIENETKDKNEKPNDEAKEKNGEESSVKDNETTVEREKNDQQSIDGDSKPATPSTLVSDGSKPASPSDKSKETSVDEETSDKNIPLTDEQIQQAKDVDQREVKLKRIEESAKDKEDLRPVAKLLFTIGVDLAAQHIYKDLVRVQTKKKMQKRLDERGEEQLSKLKKTHKVLCERNKSYSLKVKSCEKCGFKAESDNVIEWHLEFAHGQDTGKFECSFCDFETRLPAPFFFHMETEHGRKGRVFMKKALFSCPQCPYENNSKHAVTKHRFKCDRLFSLKRNQEPLPTDCDIPLKKPKNLIKHQPPRPANRPTPTSGNNQMKNYVEGKQIKNYYSNKNNPSQMRTITAVTPQSQQSMQMSSNATVQSILSSQGRGGAVISQTVTSNQPRIITMPNRPQAQQVQGPGGQMFTLLNTQPMMIQPNFPALLTGVRQPTAQQPIQYAAPTAPTQNISQIAQQVVAQVTQQHSASQQQKAIQEILKRAQQPAAPQGGATTPAIRPPSMTEAQAQAVAAQNPKFEICEICGGFVKDRESLRIHFYWAHKVDIQKDVFAKLNPHLKCDSCPQNFWTYQGLARHRQISHVKVRERSYRCYLCGAKNIENIITHLSAAHNVKLNTMYKTGKCLVCGLGFAGEKGLKRHIHTAHMELLKGQPDLVEPQTPPATSNFQKPPEKENSSSPVPTGLFENASKKKKFEPVCSLCNIVFPSVESFTQHCNKLHVFKCWRCSEKWASKELLQKHWMEKHKKDVEFCPLCDEAITIGRPFVRHVRRSHLKECSVVLVRMAKDQLEKYSAQLERYPYKNKAVKQKEEVIILSDDEDNGEKNEQSPNQEKISEKGLEAGDKEVLEVEGEKIVVEINQDDDDDDDDDENSVEKNGKAENDESEKSSKDES